MPPCKPRYHPGFWLISCTLAVPMIPSLGLINFLEQLIEFRDLFYLTRLPVYYKKIRLKNSQMEESPRTRYPERVGIFHILCRHVHQTRSSLNLFFFFLMSLWDFSLPSLEVAGGGSENHISLITLLASLATSRPT